MLTKAAVKVDGVLSKLPFNGDKTLITTAILAVLEAVQAPEWAKQIAVGFLGLFLSHKLAKSVAGEK